MKYRKKPVEIEAVQWTGDNIEEIVAWMSENAIGQLKESGSNLVIATLEGDMTASHGDYIIKGVNGEYYPCKPDIFEKTYQDAGVMTFGDALEALKRGAKVARSGWNGKGMWLSLSGAPKTCRSVSADALWSDNNAEFARENGGHVGVLPCITMKTAHDEILMGWLASQADMLADDWMIVE